MDYTKLKVVSDGAVAVVTLDDPSTRNALGLVMCEELAGALGQLANGLPAARALVLTGEGGAFCSGANLADAAEAVSGTVDLQGIVERFYNPVVDQLRKLPMPVVSAVRGAAAGIGASLALGADLVVTSDTAIFTPAFSRVGLVPDGGATWLLPRLVGKARAMELLLLGESLSGPKALEWGLANRCVPDAQALQTAMELARRLANGPAALAMTRRLILDGLDQDWENQLRAEAKAQGVAGRTDDFREGVDAFMAKRPPNFRGR
jgi:2-(1,2-epoxy-1,2-dihydrophenyl)acetyl-CoA isomerase